MQQARRGRKKKKAEDTWSTFIYKAFRKDNPDMGG